MPIAAIILAAGASARMSSFKPLLPLDTCARTALELEIDLFHGAGIDVVVVTGHRVADVSRIVSRAEANSAYNSWHDTGMLSSVRIGLVALRSLTSREGFMVLPADVPLVRPMTIARLLEAQKAHPNAVLHPTYRGHRGHPPLIPSSLASDILAWSGQGGLAGFLQTCESRDVPVGDSHVLMDMDTDTDVERIRDRVRYLEIPDAQECEAILEHMDGVNERGRVHARAVAEAAVKIARALGENGVQLDERLVRAGALLHDMAKGHPDHERAGGELLASWGLPRLAAIVGAHRDIDLPGESPITEREVVYLADKLIMCDRVVSVAERFGAKLERHGEDPEAAAAIRGRRANALRLAERIEALTGRELADIVS